MNKNKTKTAACGRKKPTSSEKFLALTSCDAWLITAVCEIVVTLVLHHSDLHALQTKSGVPLLVVNNLRRYPPFERMNEQIDRRIELP